MNKETLNFCDRMLTWGASEESAGEIALDICDRAIQWGFMELCVSCSRDCKVPGVSPRTEFKFECRVFTPIVGNSDQVGK